MNGALSAWLIALPAGGAVLAALSVFFGSGASWVRRLATWVGFGGGILAAIEMFYRLRNSTLMTSSLGGWAPPWGVAVRLDGSMSWLLLMFFVSVLLVGKRTLLEDAGSRARRISLRLLFLSASSAALLMQDALSRAIAVSLMGLVLSGLLMEEKVRVSVDGPRPPFDLFLRVSVGLTVLLGGVGFMFARTGAFDLGGWRSFLASGLPFPAVGAAFLLMVLGSWILAGLYPSPGWQGAAWSDSPGATCERVWFARLTLLLAIDLVQHVAVSPSGLPAMRLWDATRWVAWVAFALCLLTALTTADRRKMWGRLDVAGLALLWALSVAAYPLLIALVVAQSFALSLGALAPSSHRALGIWVLKVSCALLLPGWWIASSPEGWDLLSGSWGVVAALTAFTFVILRAVRPLSPEEATSTSGERPFLLMFSLALGGYGMLLLLH